MARFQVVNETDPDPENEWRLCFQFGRYIYDDGTMQEGYRFIWRRPDGSLQAARGQARLPSLAEAQRLMQQATAAGWGSHECN
jgi:hypothetical protein